MKPPQATGAELRLRHAETNTSHAALSSQLQTCFFPYFCHIKHLAPASANPLPRTRALFWFERSVSRPWNGQNPILRQQATWQFLRVSGCLKLDHPGIAAMAAMDIMILLKKDGLPLIFAQLRWNDVQTTVNIWKLIIAFDPKGPWKSFRKSHRYRGFVWNPARFDGMHDLVQMVNENYRKNHKITGNMGFLAPFLVIITIFLWFS